MGQRQADAAYAEEGVAFVGRSEAGNRFVGARVERADDHRPAVGPLERAPVDAVLRILVRKTAVMVMAEQELGTEKSDTVAEGLPFCIRRIV